MKKNILYGWSGRILHVNLTEKVWWLEYPDESVYQTWIGGKGLAGKYLQPYIKFPYDSPDMPVILMTGPLVGTASPTSGRMCIMSRSPLTGTVGDCSVGGSLGTELKKADLDGLVITGKSDTHCGIEIFDDSISITNAEKLAGKKTSSIYDILSSRGSVASVGLAAENGVLFSNIMVDGCFTAGRNGLGLVLASKNLKYLTVKGSGSVRVQDTVKLNSAREDVLRLVSSCPVLTGEYGIADYGTGALFDLMISRRMMPTSNFRKTSFKKAKSMNAPAYRKMYNPGKAGCRGCHILCKKKGKDGVHIPEFETMSHFSALLENSDIEVVREANTICNQYGMDTISAAATLSCFSELTGEKLSGEKILSLLENIAAGKGIGRELGKGSYRFAEARGRQGVSISVKKQELPAYDPRGAYGMALAYVTSTRGACHLRAYPVSHEILRRPVATDRFSFAGKARIIKIAEDLNSVIDSLTACKFMFFAASLEEYAKVYSAVTGIDASTQDLMDIGERIYYRERIMNSLNGFTSVDDDLPERFFTEEGSSGNGLVISPLDRKKFLKARADYYRIRCLDKNGLPLPEKILELELE